MQHMKHSARRAPALLLTLTLLLTLALVLTACVGEKHIGPASAAPASSGETTAPADEPTASGGEETGSGPEETAAGSEETASGSEETASGSEPVQTAPASEPEPPADSTAPPASLSVRGVWRAGITLGQLLDLAEADGELVKNELWEPALLSGARELELGVRLRFGGAGAARLTWENRAGEALADVLEAEVLPVYLAALFQTEPETLLAALETDGRTTDALCVQLGLEPEEVRTRLAELFLEDPAGTSLKYTAAAGRVSFLDDKGEETGFLICSVEGNTLTILEIEGSCGAFSRFRSVLPQTFTRSES